MPTDNERGRPVKAPSNDPSGDKTETSLPENLIEDLRHEIEVRREVAKREEDAEYRARAAAHRAEWARRTPTGMSFSERRAVQLASVEPRPDDYTGKGSA